MILYATYANSLQITARTTSAHPPWRIQLHKPDISSVEKQSDYPDSLYRTLTGQRPDCWGTEQLTVHALDDDLLLKVLLTTRTL
jgi:hypothetical protein